MAKRFGVKMKQGINVPRVIAKTTAVIIALYVGNEIINQVGTIVNGTSGPFNTGFKLIGWTVGTSGTPACSSATEVCSTSGAGVLSVIGVVGVASIVLEFITFNLY